MKKRYKNGRIIVGKCNVDGEVLESICVELERTSKDGKEKQIIRYALLGLDGRYQLDNIDSAVRSGLKREFILQEIEKYKANRNNLEYLEEMRKKGKKGDKEDKKEKSNSNDSIESKIYASVTLDELAQVYYELEKINRLTKYKNMILSRLKEINIDNPFFYVNYDQYDDKWVDEKSEYYFNLYLTKIDLLLQKYKDVKYDDIIDFNGVKVQKKDYLEELLYNVLEQWQTFNFEYYFYQEETEKFFSIYSKFESAQYSSYAIAMLNFIYGHSLERKYIIIPENIKNIILLYIKKFKNKMEEISIPSLSFEYSYIASLENNSCIDYAKAFLQASSNEEKNKLNILENKIKNSFFNVEEYIILFTCVLEGLSDKNLEIAIIALTILLDNNNLKNNPNFKRLHFLFYQYVFYYLDSEPNVRILLKIKELYHNNCNQYDEEIKSEFESNTKHLSYFK